MNTSVMSAAALTTAAFVSLVQYQHHQTYPLSPGHMEVSVSRPQSAPSGDVWIFGHAYPAHQIRSWFDRIEGKYCLYGDRVYHAGAVPGQPISYPQFVLALQQGFYFPELAGVGTRNDEERDIHKQTSYSHQRKSQKTPSIFRFRN